MTDRVAKLMETISKDNTKKAVTADIAKLALVLEQYDLVPKRSSAPAPVVPTTVPLVTTPAPVRVPSKDPLYDIIYKIIESIVEPTPAPTQPTVVPPIPKAVPVTVVPRTVVTPAPAVGLGRAAESATGPVNPPIVVVTLNQAVLQPVEKYFVCVSCCQQREHTFVTPDAVVPVTAGASPASPGTRASAPPTSIPRANPHTRYNNSNRATTTQRRVIVTNEPNSRNASV